MLSRGSHGKVLLPAGPVSSFQLGSYKLAASFSRLAPTAGSLKNYLRSPLRHSFWAAPQGPFIQFGTILPNPWQKVKYKFSFHIQGAAAFGGCAPPAGLIRPSPGGRERSRGIPPPGSGCVRSRPLRGLAFGGLRAPAPRVLFGGRRRRGLFSAFQAGRASGGPTFGRPKVGGKTAGETPDPLFCLIGGYQGEIPGSH